MLNTVELALASRETELVEDQSRPIGSPKGMRSTNLIGSSYGNMDLGILF